MVVVMMMVVAVVIITLSTVKSTLSKNKENTTNSYKKTWSNLQQCPCPSPLPLNHHKQHVTMSHRDINMYICITYRRKKERVKPATSGVE